MIKSLKSQDEKCKNIGPFWFISAYAIKITTSAQFEKVLILLKLPQTVAFSCGGQSVEDIIIPQCHSQGKPLMTDVSEDHSE